MSVFSCFVTGTDTDIGKTLVSATLLHQLKRQGLRTVGMKPVAAGCVLQQGQRSNADIEQLQQASSIETPLEMRCQYLFDPFCAPHIAAARNGVQIELAPIVQQYHALQTLADAIIIEGVGGFCVPLSAQYDTADLAQRLNAPVLLVVGLRLGCINHALLTQEAVRARGLQLLGWVGNLIDPHMAYPDENIATLKQKLHAPCLGIIPRLTCSTPQQAGQAVRYLDFASLSSWPH
ncbi:dethiobiotin synthase [Massilia sp. W12]|uniref:dethiobiotin synthase n=1 Tax=Massilia sp. W12 TaxID=3126507 RepID=UPI0030CB8DBA